MFEVTVIENYPDGSTLMFHDPFDDDEDEQLIKMIESENACVRKGILLSFTTITHYEPHNRRVYYQGPAAFTL